MEKSPNNAKSVVNPNALDYPNHNEDLPMRFLDNDWNLASDRLW
jgi:hypothetical protein